MSFSGKKFVSCVIATFILIVFFGSALAGDRSYVSGNFFLVVNGIQSGFVKSVKGGAISAEVINEATGPNYYTKKHIGPPKYEEIEITTGFNNSDILYEWIAKTWQMSTIRYTGSIVDLDYTLTPKTERQFYNALITETTLPALDGSSKEPAYMTVKVAPEFIRIMKGSGGKQQYGAYGKNEQKIFLPSNFMLQIDGLDCTRVSRIEPITVKQGVVTGSAGQARDYSKEPGKPEFSNLKITLPEAYADSFMKWHESFVIKGQNGENFEKNGLLTFLSPNRKSALVIIEFKNIGIYKIEPDKSEANADQIKRIKVEMYVERMNFIRPKQVN